MGGILLHIIGRLCIETKITRTLGQDVLILGVAVILILERVV